MIALGRKAIVVIVQLVLLGRGDGRVVFRPVRCDNYDGARRLGCTNLEELGNAGLQGVDDFPMVRVAEDWQWA